MIFLCFLVFLGSLCAFAEDTDRKPYPSLFFKDEEIVHFYKNQKVPYSQNDLTLLAILYYDANHWTLWINDKIIRPDNIQELEGFHIKKVFPHKVELSKLSEEGEHLETITLRPYQKGPWGARIKGEATSPPSMGISAPVI